MTLLEEGVLEPAPGTTGPLDDHLQALVQEVDRLKAFMGEEAAPLDQSVADIRAELEAIRVENQELQQYAEQALQQAERLKNENEELRKLSEDAVLDQQLVKALNETEKLQVAANAYKKDLLQQKLGERDIELQSTQERLQAAERQLAGLSSTLTDVRKAHQETVSELEQVKRDNARLQDKEGVGGGSGSVSQPEMPSSTGDDTLATRLAEAQPGSVDAALLTAAAVAVRESSALDKQLKRAREENERLTKEVKELNETVFSKSFKAPSAWAEREVKYKMEKRAWEAQVARLKQDMDALTQENAAYRESNKTAEFEARIQELEGSVKQAEQERTRAQQEAHALQLQLRQVPTTLHRTASGHWEFDEARLEDGVHHIIEELEGAGLGVQQSRHRLLKGQSRTLHLTGVPGETPISSSSSLQDVGALARDGTAQDMIHEYDEARIMYGGPNAPVRSQRRRRCQDDMHPDAYSSDPPLTATDIVPGAVGQLRDGYAGGSPPRHGSPRRSSSSSLRKPSRLAHADLASPDEDLGLDKRTALYLEQGGVHQPTPSGTVDGQESGILAPFATTPNQERVVGTSKADFLEGQGSVTTRQASGGPADARGNWEHLNAEGAATSTMPAEPALGESGAPRMLQPRRPPPPVPIDQDSAQRPNVDGGAAADSGGSLQAAVDGTYDSIAANPAADRTGPAEAAAVLVEEGDVLPLDSHTAKAQRGVLHQAGVALEEPHESRAEDGTGAEGAPRAREGTSMEMVRLDSAPATTDEGGVAAQKAMSRGRMIGPEASGRERSRRHVASAGGRDDAYMEIVPADGIAGRSLDRPAENGQGAQVSRKSSGSAPESPWTEEKRAALLADKQDAETQWGNHVTEQDVGTLRWRAAELETRVEMADAQMQKMQRALERADQDKARLEQELAAALAVVKGVDFQDAPTSLRDRLRRVVSLKPTINERLQDTEATLQESKRERAALQAGRDTLFRQLQGIAAKISAGQIPEPSELELPPDPAQDAAVPTGRTLRKIGSYVGGLTDEEQEVSRMREENGTLMETLVRTKVEMAETQGDYLKMRRALIRSVEKQADLADRMESLKAAFSEGNMAGVTGLMAQAALSPRAHNGDIESLGERSVY